MNLPAAREFILQRLLTGLDPRMIYHNYQHTLDVCHTARELGVRESVSPGEMETLETAALFHDTGLLDGYADHEEKSAEYAAEHLPRFGFPEEEIRKIRKLIRCTRLPQEAESRLDQILCDADLYYLGQDEFFVNSFKLKLEWKLFGVRDYTLREWLELQQKFLSSHRYFTATARSEREQGKKRHLTEITELLHHLQ
jgi:HD superfamily phosphodiesterase